jgi:type VI secretion system protein VasG
MELEKCMATIDTPVLGYIEQTITLLKGLRGHYEMLYGVVITDDALKVSASLSARYLTERQLSDSAIELLVVACVKVKEGLGSKPQVIEKLEFKIKQLNKKIDLLDGQKQDLSVLNFLLTCVDNLTLQLVASESLWHQEVSLIKQITECNRAVLPGVDTQVKLKELKDELAELQHGSPLLHYEVTSTEVHEAFQ